MHRAFGLVLLYNTRFEIAADVAFTQVMTMAMLSIPHFPVPIQMCEIKPRMMSARLDV